MARQRRRYTDADRATALAALDANGGDESATARQLGIPRETLRRWIGQRTKDEEALVQLHQGKKRDLADHLEAVAYRLAEAIPSKIDTASLQQISVSLGIAIEKMRLLRDQATSISGNTDMSDEARIERLRELAERARQRRLGLSHAG